MKRTLQVMLLTLLASISSFSIASSSDEGLIVVQGLELDYLIKKNSIQYEKTDGGDVVLLASGYMSLYGSRSSYKWYVYPKECNSGHGKIVVLDDYGKFEGEYPWSADDDHDISGVANVLCGFIKN